MGNEAHKAELHRRVVERRGELVATLEKLRKDPRTLDKQQFRAVDDAIGVVDSHLQTEWTKVDAMEAAALSKWLESTHDIVMR